MVNHRESYRLRRWNARWWPAIVPVALVGCAVHDDVSFNPYAPNNGDPTLLECADAIVETAEQAVRDLDLRLENAVY
jgi:hypothetical protein